MWEVLLREVPLGKLSKRQRRLLPAVARNLDSLCRPYPERLALQEARQRTLESNTRLRQACAEVVRLLEGRGIPVIVLKGLPLNLTVHRDESVRPAHEFDLLVPLAQAVEAFTALQESGWQPASGSPQPLERLENAADFRRGDLKLDLHWHLLREARQEWADLEFWRDRRRLDFSTFQAYALSPTHQLFHLLAVARREPHHLTRYLYDLHVFLREPEPFDLAEIHRLLRERHLLHRLQSLPLEMLKAAHLRASGPTPLFDRLWSTVTRQRHDQLGEWNTALFPFFDYLIHFRQGQPPGWRLKPYLERRFQIGANPWRQVVKKLIRLFTR